MTATVLRMSDKTTTAPYFAATLNIHRLRPFRPHDFMDVALVIEGEGWHVSSGHGEPRMRRLARGDIIVYRPNDEILLRGVEPEGITLRYVSSPVGAWQIFSSLVGVDRSWLTSEDPPVVETDPDDPDVRRAFDVALDRFHAGSTSLDLVEFWVAVIPVVFPSFRRRLAGTGSPAWLSDGVEAMREEANLRGGVPRLLELAHVSAAHLSATVRRYYHCTPTELVTLLRLRHAAFLLTSTSLPVGQVAARCGFASTTYFSTTFRREHVLTPSEFRARAAMTVPASSRARR